MTLGDLSIEVILDSQAGNDESDGMDSDELYDIESSTAVSESGLP